jgi:hypothetical protein
MSFGIVTHTQNDDKVSGEAKGEGPDHGQAMINFHTTEEDVEAEEI